MPGSNSSSNIGQSSMSGPHLLRYCKVFRCRSFVVQQPAASRLELFMEDSVGQLVALHQGVGQLGTAAHHLLHRSTVEGQQLAQLEAQHQRQAACQDLLNAYLQEQPCINVATALAANKMQEQTWNTLVSMQGQPLCRCRRNSPCIDARTALVSMLPVAVVSMQKQLMCQ